MSQVTARLEGRWEHPVLVASVPYNKSLTAAIRAMPVRWWDHTTRTWRIEQVGPDPAARLARLGFTLTPATSLSRDRRLDAITDLAGLRALADPWVEPDPDEADAAIVRPRLAGWASAAKTLGPGLFVNTRTGLAHILLADLAPDATLPAGIEAADSLAEAARADQAAWAAREQDRLAHFDPDLAGAAETLGRLTRWPPPAGRDGPVGEALDLACDRLGPRARRLAACLWGEQPSPFTGATPYWYQTTGALAMAAGTRLCADEMGVGKTLTLLLAAWLTGASRTLCIVPPVAAAGWEGAAGWLATDGDDPVPVVRIRPERRVPDLPDAGLVVVQDSLLAARPPLAARVADWAPQVVCVDEAHRYRNWTAERSTMLRRLTGRIRTRVPGLVVLAASGTPIVQSPADLATPLHVTGACEEAFGSPGELVGQFTTTDRFGRHKTRKRASGRLRATLDAGVWTRRKKDDVWADRPDKVRQEVWVDVDLAGFRTESKAVAAQVGRWVRDWVGDHGRPPDDDDVADYTAGAPGFVSGLRKATGLAKVAAVGERLADWAGQETPEHGVWERPLIVWAWHHEVIDALADAARKALGKRHADQVAVLDGATSPAARDRIVDDFQAGRVGVLIAQIEAAGVAITLTRAREAWFAEVDWLDDKMAQAEDRIHRRGQSATCTYVILLADQTLDWSIHTARLTRANRNALVTGVGRETMPPPHPQPDAAGLIAAMAHAEIARLGAPRAGRR